MLTSKFTGSLALGIYNEFFLAVIFFQMPLVYMTLMYKEDFLENVRFIRSVQTS